MEESNNMYSEAILGMLSEMSKKLDAIQAKEIQPVIQKINPVISKEDIEAIVKERASLVGNYVEHTFKVQTDHHNKIYTSIKEVKKQIAALPIPEKVNLQPLIDLYPKSKKVTICGFEFLRTSVIIFVLVLISFFSLVLNIKQMDDYQSLKAGYIQLTEYIQKVQTADECTDGEAKRTK